MLLEDGAFAVGKTLKELELNEFEVTIDAIKRGHVRGENPSPKTRLRLHDHLVLSGAAEDISAAEKFVTTGKRVIKK